MNVVGLIILPVRFFVGLTDYDWFSYLSAQQADEVNFWQPSGNTQFRALQPGEPFLFKLHSPRNVIAGGGYFSHFSLSPLSFAWSAFQEKNGAHSLDEMRERVWKYKRGQPQRTTAHSDAKQGRKAYGNVTDTLLFYSKAGSPVIFNQQHQQYSASMRCREILYKIFGMTSIRSIPKRTND